MDRTKTVAQKGILMRRSTELTILDRLEYGAISAFFGLLIGGLIALFVWWFLCSVLHAVRSYDVKLVEFSIAYFFVMGLVRGAEVAETIVLGLIAIVGAAMVNLEVAVYVPTGEARFAWQPSMWWPVIYFVGVGLIAWLAPGR